MRDAAIKQVTNLIALILSGYGHEVTGSRSSWQWQSNSGEVEKFTDRLSTVLSATERVVKAELSKGGVK